MFDKILLVLLLMLLPLGLWGGKVLSQKQPKELEGEEQVSAEELKTILSQIGNPNKAETNQAKEITISGVTYATESGLLRVGGVAPNNQLSVLVSATRLPGSSKEASGAAELGNGDSGGVLGRKVEVMAIEAGVGGGFVYEYNILDYDGILELRFDQGNAQATVQYDFAQKKQVY